MIIELLAWTLDTPNICNPVVCLLEILSNRSTDNSIKPELYMYPAFLCKEAGGNPMEMYKGNGLSW